MSTTNTVPSARRPRAVKAALVLLSLPFSLLPPLVRTASAAPPPVASTPAPPAPAPASTSTTEQPSSTEPAAAVAAEPSVAPAVPPPVTTAPPSNPAATTVAPPPPKQAKQEEYEGPPMLLGNSKKKLKVGGYGGPTIAYTHMLHRDGVLVGGEGAVLIDHRLSFGGAGYVFSRSPDGPPASDGTPREFFTGYGGFLIRYAVYSDIPVYASFGTLIGGGAITLAPRQRDDNDEANDENVETRGFFVLQPDISLHANATRWLRFGLTFGYRIASAVEHFDYQGGDMSGPVVGGNIQGGWF